MARVTFGQVIGDALRRGASGLPDLAVTMADLEARKRQEERQSSQDEAEQQYRDELLKLRQGDQQLAQDRFNLDFAIKNPTTKRMLETLMQQNRPAPTPSVDDQLANLFATNPDKYYEHLRRVSEAKNAGKPQGGKSGITPLQLSSKVTERAKQGQSEMLSNADAYALGQDKESSSIKNRAQLAGAAQEGLNRMEDAPGLFTGDQPAPDSTLFDYLRQHDYFGTPTYRRAAADSIRSGQLFPEIFGGQADTTITPEKAAEELRRRGVIQ